MPPETVKGAERAQHRILDDVIGVDGRAREPSGQVVGRIQVRQGLRLEPPAAVIHEETRLPGQAVYSRDLALFSGPVGKPVQNDTTWRWKGKRQQATRMLANPAATNSQ